MRNILLAIFLLIFTFSFPFPLFLQKSQKSYEIDALESLDILIEETENGISLLEAWSVARNGESFLEVKDEKVSNSDLRAIIRITKLSTNHGIALAPLLRSYRSELLVKKELKNLIGVEAGSAKATTLLLALLPLLLLLLAQMSGLDVVNTLRHSFAAQISLAFSITLQLLGRHWARRIINAIQ
jgi:Flp pilus assembly protein TadB